MKILILHRVPYQKIDYHRGIDHAQHDVVYLGEARALADLPRDLPCRKIVRTAAAANTDLREACLVALAGERGFDRIVSLSEYELLLAAELRKTLGVTGPSVDEVLLVRDKVCMKRAIEVAGLRVPRHSRGDESGMALGAWTGKTVLKPVDGASSEGVNVFPSRTEALVALRKLATSELERWELEEFITGPILHFDGLAVGGRAAAVIASRYVGNCLAFSQGHPLGSVQIPFTEVVEPSGARAWVDRCLGAVGITNGSFHLEAIATPAGLCFLEIGARVGGADVVACFELATGLHLPSEELKLIVAGDSTQSAPPTAAISRGAFGWFVFPFHHLHGESIAVEGVARYSADPCVIVWNQRTTLAVSNGRISYQALDAPLAGIVGGRSYKDLEGFLTSLFDSARIVAGGVENNRRQFA